MFLDKTTVKLGDETIIVRRLTVKELRENRAIFAEGRECLDEAYTRLVAEHCKTADGKPVQIALAEGETGYTIADAMWLDIERRLPLRQRMRPWQTVSPSEKRPSISCTTTKSMSRILISGRRDANGPAHAFSRLKGVKKQARRESTRAQARQRRRQKKGAALNCPPCSRDRKPAPEGCGGWLRFPDRPHWLALPASLRHWLAKSRKRKPFSITVVLKTREPRVPRFAICRQMCQREGNIPAAGSTAAQKAGAEAPCRRSTPCRQLKTPSPKPRPTATPLPSSPPFLPERLLPGFAGRPACSA